MNDAAPQTLELSEQTLDLTKEVNDDYLSTSGDDAKK
jgi:hypothetical protein